MPNFISFQWNQKGSLKYRDNIPLIKKDPHWILFLAVHFGCCFLSSHESAFWCPVFESLDVKYDFFTHDRSSMKVWFFWLKQGFAMSKNSGAVVICSWDKTVFSTEYIGVNFRWKSRFWRDWGFWWPELTMNYWNRYVREQWPIIYRYKSCRPHTFSIRGFGLVSL
jgi:hypothetical protein